MALSLPLLFGLLVYAVTLVRAKHILGDPDTYWHIVLGNWIIAHRAVPHEDLWSYTKADAPFVPMEWLAEVIIAGFYNLLGWGGLAGMAALAAAAALALQLRLLLRHLLPVHALMVGALSWMMIVGHILARPHIFSLPIMVAWSAALLAARDGERPPSPWLLPLMALWANLHASYLLGLGLSGLFALEAVLAAPDWPGRVRAARGWGLFCVLAFLAALLTPYGVWSLLQPLKLLRMHFALAILSEWQSPNFENYQPLELWILLFAAVAFTLSWRLPAMRLLMVLFLLHMALAHRRNVEVLGLVGPFLLAPALFPKLENRPGEGRLLSFLDRSMAELGKPASAFGTLLASVLFILVTLAGLPPRRLRHGEGDITPAAALAVAAVHGVKGRVLNDYSFGGYLIFRGIKTFIDGRADFYGDPFIRRYYDAVNLVDDSLPKLLEKYHITWILLQPREPAVRLIPLLPGWRQIYADKIAVLDVRENARKR